jgi:acetyltransferase
MPPVAKERRAVALDDGRDAHIRPLNATDRARYEEAVAGLSARSRYLRFAAPLSTIGERLLDQMMHFDGERHVVYAALTPDETRIVGVARYVRSPDDPQSAEVAIAVADDWQGHGLGAQLFEQVIERARLARLDSLIATTLSENRVAARLARTVGFSMVRRAGIYTDYELRLNAGKGRAGGA